MRRIRIYSIDIVTWHVIVKFSEAFYIRRQQQRYLSDDMMTATCRILFADE